MSSRRVCSGNPTQVRSDREDKIEELGSHGTAARQTGRSPRRSDASGLLRATGFAQATVAGAQRIRPLKGG